MGGGHAHGGPSADDAGGVVVVIAGSSARVETTASAPASVALLVRSQCTGNEDERTLNRREYVTRRLTRKRDSHRFVAAQGRAMLRETSVLLFRYCGERLGLCHARQEDNNRHIADQGGAGEGTIWRVRSRSGRDVGNRWIWSRSGGNLLGRWVLAGHGIVEVVCPLSFAGVGLRGGVPRRVSAKDNHKSDM